MDFELTEEQKMLKANVKDFLEKEISPIVDERDRKGTLSQEEVIGFIKKLMPLGDYIGNLPQEYGGPGIDNKTVGILWEELGRVWVSLCGTVAMAAMTASILPLAPEEVKKRFLPRILAGELIGPMAITEPNAGSNTSAMQTRAVLGGGEYIINGTKTWISDAPIANVVNVISVVTDKSRNILGVAIILVEKEVSPFTTRELSHIGWRAMPTGEIAFEDCHVPKENMLVDPTEGYKMMTNLLDIIRSDMALLSAGISQAAIDDSIKYACERTQFGRQIGSFQLIQNMIYEMIAETEASRLLGYRALDLLDKQRRCHMEVSLAKAYATEAAIRVTSKAIQIHGAMGLSEDYPVERYFRDARMLTIPDGATEIHKLIVGREALGIKAFV